MPDQDPYPKARAIEKMVRPSAGNQDRYRLLDPVFENLALGTWSAVRRLLGEGAEVGWEATSTARFADYCEAIEPKTVFGIFRLAQWDGEGLIAMDAQLVDAVVESLLGGGHVVSTPPEPREQTMVDRAIAGRFMRLAIEEFGRAFARTDSRISPLTAKLIRLESDVRLLTVARRDETVTRATFEVVLGPSERGGRFDVLLPPAMLEPARRILLNAEPSSEHDGDRPSSSPLRAVLPEAPITLHAVLDRLTLSIADIAQWQEGTLLQLGVDAERPTIVYGEREEGRGPGRKMFVGRLGASQGRKAVRILEVIPESADTVGMGTLP